MAYRILIVDDEAALQNMVKEILTQAGYETTSALTCAQALEQFRSAAPDAVLLDVNLPDGDGFSLFVKEGDRVKTGDPLISFTPEKIRAAGHPMTTAFLITDNGSVSDVRFRTGQDAKAGQTVIAEFD